MAASLCSMPSPRRHPPCRCPTARSRSKVSQGQGCRKEDHFLPHTHRHAHTHSHASPQLTCTHTYPNQMLTHIPICIHTQMLPHALEHPHSHAHLTHLDTHPWAFTSETQSTCALIITPAKSGSFSGASDLSLSCGYVMQVASPRCSSQHHLGQCRSPFLQFSFTR